MRLLTQDCSLPLPLQNPEAWLKKECSIRQLSISLDQHLPSADGGLPSPSQAAGAAPAAAATPAPSPAHSYQPLLRVASLSASALLPVFAWLEVRFAPSACWGGAPA